MQKDIELTKAAGMNAHLSKPIDINEIYKIIEKYFEWELIYENNNLDENKQVVLIDGIDLARVSENMMENDYQTIYPLYDMFKKRYEKFSEKIKGLDKNSKEFKEYIHSLKGTSGNLCIYKVHELCKKIEITDEPSILIDELSNELSHIIKEISNNISPRIKVEQKELDKNEIIREFNDMIDSFEEAAFVSRSNFNQFISNISEDITDKQKEQLNKSFDIKEFESLSSLLKEIKKEIENEK
jgi:HPt (histidine-containing phosphotransfer) domain-containing protein